MEAIYSRSEKQLGLAKDALHKVTMSDDYLDKIREHLEDIQNRNLLELVTSLENNRQLDDQRSELLDAQQQYETLRELFDKFKVGTEK